MADLHFDRNFTDALMNAVTDGVTVIDRDLRIMYQLGETCFAAYGNMGTLPGFFSGC